MMNAPGALAFASSDVWAYRIFGAGKLHPGSPSDAVLVLATIDDLHVVDAHHRHAVVQPIECRPGLEIANHELGPKATFSDFSVHFDVLANALRGAAQILEQALRAIERIAEIAEREPVDLLDAQVRVTRQPLDEEAMRPP